MYRLARRQIVPRARAEVFAFFADAGNLEALTPPFLRFHIETPRPIPMHPGTLIDYRLSLYGIPVRWRTLIELFQDGERFVDLQLKGPYKSWHHLHTFRDVEGGTEIGDTVDYELPFGPVGRLAHPLVARTLRRIFDHRERVISEHLG